MDTGLCFLSGFIGGVVAWEAITIFSIIYCTPRKDRAPKRALKSGAQSANLDSSEWRGVHLDTWA